MPELPDVEVYVSALTERLAGQRLERIRLKSPFLLRSVAPPLDAAEGRDVTGVRRLGKRIVLDLEGDLHLVLHLMIAGRLAWEKPGAKLPGRIGLAAFDFPAGTLLLREAGTKKRASLHLVRGEEAVRGFDRGGLEVLGSDLDSFRAALSRENHTLKRAMTDPRILSGVGNAYSDEILHRARLSPMKQTARLTDDEMARLHRATQEVLELWTRRLRDQAGGELPRHVTAFRDGMAVHGRFGEPCPDCGSPVQRIVYAENECNYCARCQNEGRLLADRALSRLLKSDWPRTLEELEELRQPRGPAPAGSETAATSGGGTARGTRGRRR
ncbi:MAG TPA: DNA-formamidopyrimidine glycosylase family protein [Thermoanaerobaculia bacterium]|nr:DNA-formamidopyrimidine glycosylase family protein [Thermoanaerobaculia bacterium]